MKRTILVISLIGLTACGHPNPVSGINSHQPWMGNALCGGETSQGQCKRDLPAAPKEGAMNASELIVNGWLNGFQIILDGKPL